MISKRLAAPVLLALASMSGCNPQESAWEEARNADTVSAYETFLQEYPDSPHVEEAEGRVLALQQAELWRKAREADSTAEYERFLAEFPQADQAEQARRRITELEREQEWERLRGSNDMAGLRAFAEQYRGHPLAEQARARAEELEAARRAEQARLEEERRRAEEATRTHRVQLAAFQSEDRARRGVTVLEQQLADVLGNTGMEVQSAAGMYMVRTEPVAEEDARSMCERMKRSGQDCLVVER